MFSFLSSSPLGLEMSDTTLRVASALQRGGRVLIQTCGESDLPGHVMEGGIVRDPKKCAEVLRALMQSLQPPARTRRVVLCLPPEKVYTHVLPLPPATGNISEGMLLEDVSRVIPEEAANLRVASRILRTSAEKTEVGIAAVRKDVLQGYLDALGQVPLEIVAITTIPAVLAPMTNASRECTSFLLVLEGKGVSQTVTLFERKWPVDEAVCGTREEFLAETQGMLTEGRGEGRTPPERVVVYAEDALRKHVREFCENRGGITMEAFPEIGGIERRWIGVIAASLAGRGSLSLDLSGRRAGRRQELFILASLGIALAIGVLWYFLWSGLP